MVIEREYFALFVRCFHNESDGYIIFLPDFGNGTCSDTKEEGIKYAKEVLELSIHGMNICDIPVPRPKEAIADIYVVEVPYYIKDCGTIFARKLCETSMKNTLVAHVAVAKTRRHNKDECDIWIAELSEYAETFTPKLFENINDIPTFLRDGIQFYLDGKDQSVIHEFPTGEDRIKIIPIPVLLNPDNNGIVRFDNVIEFARSQ